MKTLLVMIGFSILTWNAIEDLPVQQTGNLNQYCVKLKDGMLVVVNQGHPLPSDITLANGVVIKKDGTIIKKDGSKVVLAVDECADEEGNIVTDSDSKLIQNPH